MKNKARAPYHLRKQIQRWTRPPALSVVMRPTVETCEQTPGRHVWVSRNDPPLPDERCECGKFAFGPYRREHGG